MKRWFTRAVGILVASSVASSALRAQNYPYYPPPMRPAPNAYYPGAAMPNGPYGPGPMPGYGMVPGQPYPGMPMVRPGMGPAPGVPMAQDGGMVMQGPAPAQPGPAPAETIDTSAPAVMDPGEPAGGPNANNGSSGGLRAGAGFYFVKPYFERNPAFSFSVSVPNVNINLPAADFVLPVEEFDYRMSFSPRVWIAYVNDCGMGARFRFWRFEQSAASKDFINADPSTNVSSPVILGIASQTVPSATPPILISTGSFLRNQVPPVGADLYEINTGLQLDVWDVEGLREFIAGRWTFQISGGIRYAHIGQDYQLDRSNSGTSGAIVVTSELETLRAGHSFQGVGPMAAFNARRQLGDSNFSLVCDVRGATLIGRGSQKVTDVTNLVGATAGVPFNELRILTSSAERNDTLPIVEVEIGTKWQSDGEGPHFFAETGIVGQTWFGAGNGSSEDGNLSFFGLTFVTGVQY